MNKKRKLLLSLLFLLLAAVGIYSYSVWQLARLNTSFRFMETEGNLISSFESAQGNTILQPSGNIVVFAVGSRHSFISYDSALHLKELGYPVEFMNTLIYTTDHNGRYHFFTKKAKLDIPLINPTMPDSTFVIHDAELLVNPAGAPNILGMDLLSSMVIERLYPEGTVNLYKTVPEGYYTVSEIKIEESPLGNYVGSTGRATIPLTVNDDPPREYYMATAGKMADYEVVQPKYKRSLATTSVKPDPKTGVLIQKRGRVNFGNRLRYSEIAYSDTIHTAEYTVNPLKLFDQDFVLDLPGRRLMVHKTRE